MVIMQNMLALNAERMQGIKERKVANSTQKLSSGYKINAASDDAAGFAISEKMRYQIRGLNRGADNIDEGINYCQVADGALNEIHDMLQRMNELAIQAANGTNSSSDREHIDDEIQQLKKEIDRICVTTKYNDEYIFKCEDNRVSGNREIYDLTFSGYPNDLFIYNETYDDTTKTATYGGVAYRGKRYAWESISPNMYDKDTGKFRKGTYTLRADDGSSLTLICEDGSEPPQVSREFTTHADESGIYVNGELIKWEDVKSGSGNILGYDSVTSERYSFNYHGVICSFTPEKTDNFEDVMMKISGTRWRSNYKIPTEDKALYADFTQNYWNFLSDAEVKAYLEKLAPINDYRLRAGTFKDGREGVWIELNGAENDASFKTWEELGITNWGDQSTDIWSDKSFVYEFVDPNDGTKLSFKFNVINEISKDSAIDALNGIDLSQWMRERVSNHAELVKSTDPAHKHVSRAEITRDSINHSVEEEYNLGRDYGAGHVKDEYGTGVLKYDETSGVISVTYNYDSGRVTASPPGGRRYSNTKEATEALIKNIVDQIKKNTKGQLDIIKARILAGAKNPQNTSLADLINASNITGGGSSTYLEDVFTFSGTDVTLKSTLPITGEQKFAGGKIDFSGLGTDYSLADLIGLGFNSTCQTCNNHYSVQFTNQSIKSTNTNWQSFTNAAGKTYKYSLEMSGNNWNLFIDMDSIEAAGISDGKDFTNALVDIFNASGFDNHYTQYATKDGESVLYVFDNRPQYVEVDAATGVGTSTAKNAAFSPYAYDSNNMAKFDINLSDDKYQGVRISYEYNYEDIFQSLEDVYKEAPLGEYVQSADGKSYEKYDDSNPDHIGKQRYDWVGVTLKHDGFADLDAYLDNYVRKTVLPDIAAASTLNLVSDYAGYSTAADENPNSAMVTKYDTPYQIKPTIKHGGEWEEAEYLRIQCSSNTIDNIYIPKQKLSVYRMGLEDMSAKTETQATNAIDLIENALTKVNTIRSNFGAYQNRLEHSYAINRNTHENTQSAESVIRDTDMADEMIAYSNNNILAQAGFSILAQANQNNSLILNLIE